MGGDELLDTLHDVTLQILFGREFLIVLDAQLFDTGLTARAFLPAFFGAFVAADVDVFRREEFHDFRQHTLEELECLFVACAQHIFGNAPAFPYLVRAARASEFRIRGEGRQHVSRKVYLGNHLDSAVGGIGYDFANLILREIASIGNMVAGIPVLANHSAVAPAAHLNQTRVFFDFNAPPLIIGQMPVESVQFVHGHDVEVAFHLLDAEEMTRYIGVQTAVFEARRIVYFDVRQRPDGLVGRRIAVYLRRQQLLDRLKGVEETRERRGTNLRAVFADAQVVTLFSHSGVENQTHALLRHRFA